VRFACKKPHRYRLVFGSAVWKLRTHPTFLDAAEDAFEALVKMLYGDDRYDRHDLRASHVRCLHAYALFSMMNGLAHNVIDGLVSLETPKEIDDFTDAVTASFLLGVAHEELAERLS
jgi:hypothetical protein